MKKKIMDTSFVMLKNPYETKEDSIADIYRKYQADTNATFQTNDLVYYKVIQLYNLTIGTKTQSVVFLDATMQLDLNDTLIDNFGNHFDIIEFILCRISPNVFPRWYEKIIFVSIKGNISSMGDYLAQVK